MTTRQRTAGAIAAVAVLVSLPAVFAVCKSVTDQDVLKAMQIEVLETKWVMKEYKQWPRPKLILVPLIVFRIKNLTDETMTYVNFNGIFKEKDAVENRGDNFLAAIRKKNGVPPGAWSEPITLKSNFGTEGTSLKTFQNNPQWKPIWVKIFAQWKGSRHVPLGEYPVSMAIDFKEPAPATIQGDKKEPEVPAQEKKK